MEKEHISGWKQKIERVSRVSDVIDFAAVALGSGWGYAGLLTSMLMRRWLRESGTHDDNRVGV